MSNQNTELGRRLRKAFEYVAQKKGSQWAKETKAEFQTTERYLEGFVKSVYDSGEPVNLGNIHGMYVENLQEIDPVETVLFPYGGMDKRITPHDTGNLIESISVDSKKNGNTFTFSVGVDYNKLDRQRYLYSWLFERHGKPNVLVKRPGNNRDGRYVRAANRNSDEKPNFLTVWETRGKANVERIFR